MFLCFFKALSSWYQLNVLPIGYFHVLSKLNVRFILYLRLDLKVCSAYEAPGICCFCSYSTCVHAFSWIICSWNWIFKVYCFDCMYLTTMLESFFSRKLVVLFIFKTYFTCFCVFFWWTVSFYLLCHSSFYFNCALNMQLLHIRILKRHRTRMIQIIRLCVLLYNLETDLLCVCLWLISSLQIFVGNLDPNVTDDHLRQVFGQYGELVHVKIPSGKRCGFVQYADR